MTVLIGSAWACPWTDRTFSARNQEVATKYDELCEALEVWNQTVRDYDQQAIEIAKAFVRGLENFLGLPRGAIYWFRSGQTVTDRESLRAARVPFAADSRYSTGDTWAFTPAVLIEKGDLVPHVFPLPLEYLLRPPGEPIRLKVLGEKYEFENMDPRTFEPAYDEVFLYMKQGLLNGAAPANHWNGPVN
jgi:hypothetical protein